MDDPYNSLAFDEQVIAEKLGLYDNTAKVENDLNANVKMALLQNELEKNKKRVAQLERRRLDNTVIDDDSDNYISRLRERGELEPNRRRDHVSRDGYRGRPRPVGRRRHREDSDDDDNTDTNVHTSPLNNKQFLYLIIFVLVAVVFLQYYYNSVCKEEMNQLGMIMKSIIYNSMQNASMQSGQQGSSSSSGPQSVVQPAQTTSA